MNISDEIETNRQAVKIMTWEAFLMQGNFSLTYFDLKSYPSGFFLARQRSWILSSEYYSLPIFQIVNY